MSYDDPALGTRIAVWRWGVEVKRNPHRVWPVTVHVERPEDPV